MLRSSGAYRSVARLQMLHFHVGVHVELHVAFHVEIHLDLRVEMHVEFMLRYAETMLRYCLIRLKLVETTSTCVEVC